MLRRRNLGETDRRLLLLTEERGVVEAVAKGARKAGSRLAGVSEPLSVSVMHLASGKRTSYVTQTQPVSSFPGLRSDYDRLAFALALAELAETVFPHEQPANDGFRWLVESLRYLELHDKPLVATVWAKTKLLKIAGYAPSWQTCIICGRALKGANAFASPKAGGYVCSEHAPDYSDRVVTMPEVLIGLEKISKLDAPPQNLKLAREAFELLGRFWAHIAERALPARKGARNAVKIE